MMMFETLKHVPKNWKALLCFYERDTGDKSEIREIKGKDLPFLYQTPLVARPRLFRLYPIDLEPGTGQARRGESRIENTYWK